MITRIRPPTNQIQLIGDFLHKTAPTDNFSGSRRQIHTMKNVNGIQIPQIISIFRKNEIDEALKNIYFSDNKAYYTTKNGFIANQRQAAALLSLDNIVIDVDNHSGTATTREIQHEIDRLTYFLESDYAERIPEFNLTRSGRGAHLWISLDSYSAKLRYLHNLAAYSFCDTVSACIAENKIQLDVDTAASTNAAGLIRLPYTLNQHTHTFATFEERTDKRYNIDELQRYCAINVSSDGQVIEKTIERRCAHSEEDRQRYIPLFNKRLNFLNIIIEQNESLTGRRDLVLFLYANTMYQLTLDEAETAAATHKANQKLDEPLTRTEIDAIIKCIVKKGGYDFKVTSFLDFMHATTQERWCYSNMQSEREIERERNRQIKAERNAKITELHLKGYSQREIANEIGCSRNTVIAVIQKRNEESPK